MVTVNNKLTNLADEIRELSGVTEPLGLDEMATNVNDANDEVAAQATTISEIMELLEGKSISGGGEDVTAEVTAQTTLIDDLEAAVDALPDTGSGGGSIETCTVTITRNAVSDLQLFNGVVYYVALGDDGNNISVESLTLPAVMSTTQTVELSCVKNTFMHLSFNCAFVSCSGATYEAAVYYALSGTESGCGYNVFVTDDDAALTVRC